MHLLWKRNIERPIADEEIFCVEGKQVLNGAFGVTKPHDDPVIIGPDESLPVLRLIMNLIPSNERQQTMFGDIKQLPTAGQWNALALLDLRSMIHIVEL